MTHLHFETRANKPSVFHMTPELVRAAAIGWNMESEARKVRCGAGGGVAAWRTAPRTILHIATNGRCLSKQFPYVLCHK